jgi:hypothetical protein
VTVVPALFSFVPKHCAVMLSNAPHGRWLREMPWNSFAVIVWSSLSTTVFDETTT